MRLDDRSGAVVSSSRCRDGNESTDKRHVRRTALIDLLAVVRSDKRLEVMCALTRGALDISTLANQLQLDRTLVSHHISCLRRAGLVECVRQGTRRVCRLGRAVACVPRDGGLMLDLTADSGAVLRLTIGNAELREMFPWLWERDAGGADFEQLRHPHPTAGSRQTPEESPSAA